MINSDIPHGLLYDVETCLTNLAIFSRPSFYFRDIMLALSRKNIQYLMKFGRKLDNDIRHLVERYGKDNPILIASDHLSEVIEEILFLNRNDGNYKKQVGYIVNIMKPHLKDPLFCVSLMLRKSLIQTSLELMKQETSELVNELQNYMPRSLINIDEDVNADYTDEIIDSFSANVDRDSWLHRQNLYDLLTHIINCLKVENKHHLLTTKYNLYVPLTRKIGVIDPIEIIIAESTKNPSLINNLSPRQFEQYLAKIFEGFGFNVELTAQTRDGGVDILCVSTRNEIPLKIAIEAKRYNSSKPITVGLIRSFVGANAQVNANKLVFVTTSRYTKEAYRYANTTFGVNKVELKALPDIIKWANDFKQQRFSSS